MVKLQSLLLAVCCLLSASVFSQSSIGAFDGNSDIGNVRTKGTTTYNAATQQYKLSGSGEGTSEKADALQFAWKRMKGNFILRAKANFEGKGVDPQRELGWMIRTSLDAQSPMASATVQGDGLTSLQYRKATGTEVEEIKSSVNAPDVIQLERKGTQYIMSVARFGEPFTSEVISDLALGDEVYVGLFVSSHNNGALEKATFNNVRLVVPAKEDFVPYREYIGSNIEVMDVTTGNRQIIYSEPGSMQAPNWTPDNKALIYNTSEGLMYRLDLKTKKPSLINTDFVKSNNNDHVISFDGKMLGLSSSSGDPKHGSLVYTVPITGGKPKLITPVGPSYLHGWSPDGKFLIYTGQRNNELDIYKIPADGGKEINLTNSPGVDDGSEYSPDGKYIYFNSVRTGRMQLWRMKPDGSDQEQLTFDDYNNWFAHISPDGKWIAFLSYMNDIDPNDHPFYRHVYLRLMPVSGGTPKVIAYLYGGQGSINTPSWSPDSKKIAFVSNSDMSTE